MKNINISWAVFIVGIFFSLNNIFAQSSPPLIVFGLIVDTQYADCESGKTRFYRNSLGKLHESIDYFNNQKVQFTVNLGDIIDRDQKDLDSVLICLKHLNKKYSILLEIMIIKVLQIIKYYIRSLKCLQNTIHL